MLPLPPTLSGWSLVETLLPWRRRLAAITLVLFAIAVTAIWLRNRDILRDLYDYSSVIVAVGKIEAGLRPYLDFRSTMQSATYVLNWAVEWCFGANYLALTWGGLILALGGGAALAWLWRRSFGWLGAGVLAGTIAVAGLSQHVVIFYNPVGLLCFAIVTAALAADPRLWRLRSPEAALACFALLVGGMNKINFHAFTCGVAALLIARAWWMQERSRRNSVASMAMLALCGVVLPLGIELHWTGASLYQWIENVLLLPSERVGIVMELLHRDIILQPAYDIYHHFIFKQLTLVGLLLVAGTALIAWRALAGSPVRPRATLWLLLAAPTFALGSILLTVTNVETLALTSLPFVIGAAALWAPLSGYMSAKVRRVGLFALPAVSLLWAVVGGYAAWEGSRVMFGAAAPNRGSFVRLENPPPALAYLEGVRLDADLCASLRLTARELDRLHAERGNLSTVLFGPAMEWLERAYPESILPGMPVWYHQGTSLKIDDNSWLQERLASHQVDRIVLNPSWEAWPGAFREYLDRHFRRVSLGPVIQIHEARNNELALALQAPPPSVLRPLMLCRRTHSNIHLATTRLTPNLRPRASPWGDFLGGPGNSLWDWTGNVHVLTGAFVAVLQTREGPPVPATWRIFATKDGQSRLLQAGTIELSAEQPESRTTFEVRPYGDPLRFEIEIPDSAQDRLVAGWRDVWIRQSGAASPLPPPPSVDTHRDELAEAAYADAFIRHSGAQAPPAADDWFEAPFEAWRECGPDCTTWRVKVNTKRRPEIDGSPTIVFLVWYKAGRIEILRKKMVNPDDEELVELEGWMPEPGGWMGVFARAADVTQTPNCRVRIESWSPHHTADSPQ